MLAQIIRPYDIPEISNPLSTVRACVFVVLVEAVSILIVTAVRDFDGVLWRQRMGR